MGQVIVITSGKGGVGKTTTTANLGIFLAKLGKKVVLVDTDIGLRNLDIALGIENQILYDLVDVVTGVCKPSQAVIKDSRFDGLFILPAAQTKDKNSVELWQMQDLCGILKKEYDFVLIDCPAGVEQGFKNAVAGAEIALVVTTPDNSAIRDADRIIGILDESNLDEIYLVINRIRRDMVRRGDMMNADDIIQRLGINLIGIVPEDEYIIIAANKGEPVALNSKSLAAQGYKNIAERLCGNSIPLMNFGKKKFISKFKKAFSKKKITF